jgi:LPXTG-motif cell wall-anchored protein
MLWHRASGLSTFTEDTGGGKGTLPLTGANVGVLTGVGLLLIVAGGALFLVRRRRSVRFTA